MSDSDTDAQIELPFPLDYIYSHVEQFSEHVLRTVDGVVEIYRGGGNVDGHADTTAEGETDVGGSLGSLASDVVRDIMSGKIKPPESSSPDGSSGADDSTATSSLSMKDAVSSFLAAVDFQRDGYWIYPLLAFHLLTLSLIISCRKNSNFQFGSIVVLAALMKCSESINGFLRRSYVSEGLRESMKSSSNGELSFFATFSSQNYFDESGFFIFSFFAGPVLFNAMVSLMCILLEAKNLLIEVKTKEIKSKRRKKKKGTNKSKAE